MRHLILLCSVGILVLWSVMPVVAGSPEALDWLRAHQNPDGGFAGDFDSTSSLGATIEAIFAIVGGGEDPMQWDQGGNTPITFLESQVRGALAKPGDTAKLILASVAADQNPRDFGGVDLVAALEAELDDSGPHGGLEAGNVFEQSLAILALKATGRPVPAPAADWLVDVQLADGSWSWNGDTMPGSSDSNSTALAVQALVAAGGQDAAVSQALEYLRGIQNEDGGFPYQKPSDFGSDTDANSTAYVIQALIATGNDPAGDDWALGEITPTAALIALQLENGAFAWQAAVPGDNFLATVQAVPALAGKAFLDVTGSVDVGEVAAPVELPVTGGEQDAPSRHLSVGELVLVAVGLALAGTGLSLPRYV
ncbi:MAG: terpene cyclase/mutase family protein [Anaerolineales bacterium]|nr:MAG: terpene cyclase/mutase family protein [Anaerolineales bacterium]